MVSRVGHEKWLHERADSRWLGLAYLVTLDFLTHSSPSLWKCTAPPACHTTLHTHRPLPRCGALLYCPLLPVNGIAGHPWFCWNRLFLSKRCGETETSRFHTRRHRWWLMPVLRAVWCLMVLVRTVSMTAMHTKHYCYSCSLVKKSCWMTKHLVEVTLMTIDQTSQIVVRRELSMKTAQ